MYFGNYRFVVFKDFLFDDVFFICFCVLSKDIIVWEDGKEYLLVKLEIFSYFYFFYIGKMKFVDIVGCIDKFNKKFVKFNKFFKFDIEF